MSPSIRELYRSAFFPGDAPQLAGVLLAFGDGTVVRAVLDALLDALHRVAQPTGARGSVLLMTGGLIVLGFLFVSFLFRSAIVGDLATSAHTRVGTPNALLPDATRPARARPIGFEAARERGREARGSFDATLDALRAHGLDARVVRSGADWKVVRAYACASCDADESVLGCEHERGLLAGAFETLTGGLAKAHEVACRRDGAPHCEFEVRHAPLAVMRP